jgi:hypothetical protein
MTAIGDRPERISKIMSASETEVLSSLAALVGRPVTTGDLPLTIHLGSGYAQIAVQAITGVRLGKLLELPRCKVSVAFVGTQPQDRAEFLRRFEIAFQRGGG